MLWDAPLNNVVRATASALSMMRSTNKKEGGTPISRENFSG